MLLLWIFLVLFALRLLTYAYRVYRCSRLKGIYIDWISGKTPLILRYEREIFTLFKSANVHDTYLSLENSNAKNVISMFERAIGSFQYELKRNFFPNFWIKTLALVPVRIADFIKIKNISIAKSFKLIVVVIYWALGVWDIAAIFNDSLSAPLDEIIKLITLMVEKVF